MNDILFRLLVAAALTFAAFALSSSAHGQQADEDTTPTNASPQGKAQSSSPPAEIQTPPSSPSSSTSDQTQDELGFTGRIERERGSLLLKDPVTRLSYQLDDQARARKFIGKEVRVRGKLEMKNNTIHVSSIELVP